MLFGIKVWFICYYIIWISSLEEDLLMYVHTVCLLVKCILYHMWNIDLNIQTSWQSHKMASKQGGTYRISEIWGNLGWRWEVDTFESCFNSVIKFALDFNQSFNFILRIYHSLNSEKISTKRRFDAILNTLTGKGRWYHDRTITQFTDVIYFKAFINDESVMPITKIF